MGMSSKELRIGNLIEVKVGTFWKEQETPSSFIRAIEDGVLDCRPIPLTEDWLLRFGFKKGEHQFTFGINPINQDHLIVIKKTILQSSG